MHTQCSGRFCMVCMNTPHSRHVYVRARMNSSNYPICHFTFVFALCKQFSGSSIDCHCAASLTTSLCIFYQMDTASYGSMESKSNNEDNGTSTCTPVSCSCRTRRKTSGDVSALAGTSVQLLST